MRKIIVNLCTSLDFLIEGDNGEIDWCLTDQDYGMTEFLNNVDTIFLGRRSYEQLVNLLPNAFADKSKIVFSRTLKNDSKITKIISDNILDEVSTIVNQDGKNIWLFGGADLITTLLNLNLVDELIISVHPLILGKGKPLFSGINGRKKLKFKDSKPFSSGVVQLYYNIEK